jgi:hypothetical protein
MMTISKITKLLNVSVFILFCIAAYGSYDKYNLWPSFSLFIIGFGYSVICLKGIDSDNITISSPRLLQLRIERRRLELLKRARELKKRLESQQ